MQTKKFYLILLPCLVLVFVLLLSTLSDAKQVAIEERQENAPRNENPLPKEALLLRLKEYKHVLSRDGSVDCEKNRMHRIWMDESRRVLASLSRPIYDLLRKLENSPYGSLQPFLEGDIAKFPNLALATFDIFHNLFEGLPEEEVGPLKKKYSKGKNLLLTFENAFDEYVVNSLKALTQPSSSSSTDVISFKYHTATMTRDKNVLKVRYFDLLSYFTNEDFAMLHDLEMLKNFLKVLRKGKELLSTFVDLHIYQAALEVCGSLPHRNMDFAHDTHDGPWIEPEKRAKKRVRRS